MRRLLIALLLPFGLVPLASPAPAAAAERGHVDVIEVSGLLDRVVVDFVADALAKAEEGGAEAIVLQLNSGGAVVDSRVVDVLAFEFAHSPVPIGVWVGPSGARAEDEAGRLGRAAHIVGVAPGARIGGDVEEVLQAPTLGEFIVDLDGETVGGKVLETS